MGSGSWSDAVFKSHTVTSDYSAKTTDEIFTSDKIHPDLDPKNVVRESRDSADNPESTPVILALDVTGSMDRVLDSIARDGLNKLCKSIFEKAPITNPHIMCMGIGDVEAGDDAPLQVSQFEADIKILQDLEKIYLERGGGGNNHESYLFPLYFAATSTRIDSYEKRGKKGFLFTIGDEEPQEELLAADIKKIMGASPQKKSFTASQVVSMATKQWDVYHVIIEEGSHAASNPDRVKRAWQKVLGQNILSLPDHKLLGETIVATMQYRTGRDKDKIAKDWDPSKARTIAQAMRYLP